MNALDYVNIIYDGIITYYIYNMNELFSQRNKQHNWPQQRKLLLCQHVHICKTAVPHAQSYLHSFDFESLQCLNYTGPNQTWEIGRVIMKTRRHVGNREEKITTEYEKLLSLICFVDEFPKTKQRKCPQYTSE